MIIFNLVLFISLLLTLGITLYYFRDVRHQRKVNTVVSAGLEELLRSARIEIEKNKKLIASAKRLVATKGAADGASKDLIEDPALLSSVLTVIVAKYGEIILCVDDFNLVTSKDYISVYVDTRSQDLVLSLNHKLAKKDLTTDPVTLINLGNSDDTTFH